MSNDLHITEEDIQEFEAAGAICLRGLFDHSWIDLLSVAIDAGLAKDDEGKSKFQLDHTMAKENPAVRKFVFESPAAAIAKTIMRTETVRYYFDQLFVKEPGVEAPTPWHQDQPYWPVTGRQVCSIWVPLDPVTKANSGLEYVRGSHNWGQEFAPVSFTERSAGLFDNSERENLPDFNNRREDYDFLCWDMEPGDCLIHQARTVHGASGNTTREDRRRALSIRWLGDDARYRELIDNGDPNLVDPSLRPGEKMISLKFPIIET